ncbi:uncharacterized protein LOC115631534 [Scaptodrosophila lebanonensis]|uniref:Uncharacterized protein LOC115631534 n=1 Tax=Drosophila lebanonensis TaxID=7225 RepID=A0A6J2UAH7_DROLE|nr:uncharacterized protein LOC115631534 [Scaptodrosophila lebanonensis]
MNSTNTNLEHMTYNLQYFNFTAEQVSAEREQLVHSLLSNALDTAIKKVQTPATAELLAKQKYFVLGKIKGACDKKLAKLRELDSATFNVPPYVLQIQDFDLEHKLTAADEQKKITHLEELKSRYRENMAMLAELQAEQEKYDSIEKHIQHEMKIHQQICDASASFEYNKLTKIVGKLIKDHDQQQAQQ